MKDSIGVVPGILKQPCPVKGFATGQVAQDGNGILHRRVNLLCGDGYSSWDDCEYVARQQPLQLLLQQRSPGI